MKLKSGICSLIAIFCVNTLIFSQNPNMGLPLIKNYLPSEYGASSQNWYIAQDSRGIMFFGNTQCLLEFDGATWRNYTLPNSTPARSLDISPEGILYMGTFNNFGFLDVKENGQREFVSLAGKIEKKEDQNFGDIWRTVSISSGTYFFSASKIFCYSKNKLSIIPSKMEAVFGFKAYDKVFVLLKDQGIAVIENNELILLPHTEFVQSSRRMFTVSEYNNEKIIIGTRNDGFYTYDLKVFKENSKFNFKKKDVPENIVEHLYSDATEYISKNSMYSASKVNDNLFAFGTTTGGIVLVDGFGKTVRIINTDKGLNNNCVYALFADNTGNLWAALQQGIARIDLSYPLNFFNEEKNGISGYIITTKKFHGELFVGTMSGIYKYPNDSLIPKYENIKFEKLTNESSEYWDFEEIDNTLLSACNKGIFAYNGKIFENIFPASVSILHRPSNSKELLFGCLDKEFSAFSFKKVKNKISVTKIVTFQGIDYKGMKISEVSPGEIWISTDFNGLYKLTYNINDLTKYQVVHYTTDDGLPTNEYNSVEIIDNKIIITTRKGIYQLVNEKGKTLFRQSDQFGSKFSTDSASIAQILPLGTKFIANGETERVGFLTPNDKENEWDNRFSKRFPSVYRVFEFDKLLHIYTSNGLFVYDLKLEKNYKKSFQTLIRKISIKNDSMVFDGNFKL
jgi:hypothetical protein